MELSFAVRAQKTGLGQSGNQSPYLASVGVSEIDELLFAAIADGVEIMGIHEWHPLFLLCKNTDRQLLVFRKHRFFTRRRRGCS